MKTIDELREGFEHTINFCSSREMRLFLSVCVFSDFYGCYENDTGDIDLDYYAKQLNGAWWMYQELNK